MWRRRIIERISNFAARAALKRVNMPFLLASLSCLAPPAFAQQAAAPPRGAFFKITQADHTLYLFGTIHVGRADFFPLEPRVMKALAGASVLAVELDPSRQGAMQAALQRYGVAVSDADAGIPASLIARRQALLRRYGIAAASMSTMQPWLQATALTVAEFAADGYQPQYSVDEYLLAAFKKAGKPVHELESAESQLALFGRLSISEQTQFLDDTIGELEDPDGARQVVSLANLWRDADSKGLAALLKKQTDSGTFSSRFTLDVLLKQRNPPLADGLAAQLRNNRDSFAAIGILHLVGPDSVPDQLRRQGCQVEQIY
ncbi:MAG: hypothetical protein JWP38_2853 [Herbaspirillum sp.]|jgi:uncharacterized protein YbaP (TraB family)|nr:hypothetical protein [Herbaspirillum sp.]